MNIAADILLYLSCLIFGYIIYTMRKYGTDNKTTTVIFVVGLIAFIFGGILKCLV